MRKIFVSLVFLALFPLSAQAEKPGIYAGIDGVLRDVKLGSSHNVGYTWLDPKYANKIGVRIMAGLRFNQNYAIEAGYATGFKIEGHLTNSRAALHDTGEAKVQAFDLTGLYHFTEFVPGLYVRAGGAFMQVSGTSVRNSGFRDRSRAGNLVHPDTVASKAHTGLSVVAGLGYEHALFSGLSVNVGYSRYQGIAGLNANYINQYSAGARFAF